LDGSAAASESTGALPGSNGALPDVKPVALPESSTLVASDASPGAQPEGGIVANPEDFCQCQIISIKNNRKGQEKRASYSVEMKAQVILEANQSGMTQEKVAAKFNINRSMVSTWMRDKDKIMDATRRASKKFSRLRPYTKHARLFDLLQTRLNATRLQGCLTDFPWLWAEARSIHAELKDNPEAMLCAHVVILFLKRYGVRIRVQPKYRKVTREVYEPKMKRWHAELRERLVIRGGSNANNAGRHIYNDHPFDRKWGRFPPYQRFAVDSCALPIYLSRSRNVDHYKIGENDESKDKVCLTDPSHGLDRRHCSLLICLRGGEDGMERPQPRLALIFRGGRRFGSEEKTLWNKDVDVFFQERARVDPNIAAEWAKTTLGKSLDKNEGKFVLFCDNSSPLRGSEFEANIAERGGVIWRGLEDFEEGVSTASLWQPIEAGPAQLLKVLIGQAQRNWLENPENAKLWQGETKGFAAKDRRVLITHWVAQAWKKFASDEYFQFRQNAWQKTGCLMTADGSEDHLIRPEDLGTDYVVPAAPGNASFQSFVHFPTSSNGAEFAQEDEIRLSVDSIDGQSRQPQFPRPQQLSSQENSLRQHMIVPSPLGTVAHGFNTGYMDPMMDFPADRDFNHELVGRQLKILYEDGWASGKISYYNIRLGMMKVDFGEDADFVAPHDIDGIEVVLL